MYNRRSSSIFYLLALLDWGVWCGTPLDVVCSNHSPAPIYGGYQPLTGLYCGACCATGAKSHTVMMTT